MNLTVAINLKEFRKELDDIQNQQFPFAIAKTLTIVAQEAQRTLIGDLPRHFDLHSSWTAKGIRIDPAKKSDMKTKGQIESAVKDIDASMVKQETLGGRVRTSHGKPVRGLNVIPETQARSKLLASSGRIKPSMLPGRLLKGNTNEFAVWNKVAKAGDKNPFAPRGRKWGRHRKPKPFIMKSKHGNALLVAVRQGDERKPLTYLFVMSPRVQMHKRWDFKKTVEEYVRGRITKVFAEQMIAAMATRKGISQRGSS
jgi:hypothetical protein